MAIRVVLAEDSYLVREAVRRLLDGVEDVDLVAVCEDLDSLLVTIESERPDVVVTDIRMPPTSTDEGIRAADHAREVSPSTGVVVLSQYDDAEFALALFERGAEGRAYLLKERLSDVEQLTSAIRQVACGGSVIDPRVVEGLVRARSRARRSQLTQLTPRESEVLTHMAEGKNNAAIASCLVLTERAIEKHINAIFAKLGLTEEREVHRRVKAVLVYLAERGAS